MMNRRDIIKMFVVVLVSRPILARAHSYPSRTASFYHDLPFVFMPDIAPMAALTAGFSPAVISRAFSTHAKRTKEANTFSGS
jgi:hypothetical protein